MASVAEAEAQFNASPIIQQYLQQPNKSGVDRTIGWVRAAADAARAQGIRVPHDYQPVLRNGRVVLEKQSFAQRNGWLMPLIAMGTPIAAGAGISALAGAGAGSGAAGAGATTAGGTSAASVGAGAVNPSWWGSWGRLVAPALGAGASIYATRAQAGAQREAGEREAAYYEQALADAREEREYTRKRDDEQRGYDRGQYANYLGRLDPFRASGTAASQRLASSLPGIPAAPSGGGAMVRLQAPTGAVQDVPADQAEQLIARGARRV